jgi:hypothetical protein
MAYLYRHIRKDKDEVFYIGIGTGAKNNYERAFSKNRNHFWKKITNITEYEVEIMIEDDNYDFIIQKEIEFIALYGRKDLKTGTLCNLTDGGEGINNCSKESRDKISEARRNHKTTDEARLSISKATKGGKNPRALKIINKVSMEVFDCLLDASESIGMNKRTLGYNLNGRNSNNTDFFYYNEYLEKGFEKLEEERLAKIKEIKDKFRADAKNRVFSEETRKKRSEAAKGRKLSEKTIEALRIANLAENNHISKRVVNTETGEVFFSIKDAAESVGKCRTWLSQKLNGKNKNKTTFRFKE